MGGKKDHPQKQRQDQGKQDQRQDPGFQMIGGPDPFRGLIETIFLFEHKGVIVVKGKIEHIRNESRDQKEKQAGPDKGKPPAGGQTVQKREEAGEENDQENYLTEQVLPYREPAVLQSIGPALIQFLLIDKPFKNPGHTPAFFFQIIPVSVFQPKGKNRLQDIDDQEPEQ